MAEDNKVIFERVSWQGYLVHPDARLQFHGVNRKPGENQITVFNGYYGKGSPIKLGMVELIIEDNLIKEINYYIDSEAREVLSRKMAILSRHMVRPVRIYLHSGQGIPSTWKTILSLTSINTG